MFHNFVIYPSRLEFELKSIQYLINYTESGENNNFFALGKQNIELTFIRCVLLLLKVFIILKAKSGRKAGPSDCKDKTLISQPETYLSAE